MTVLASFAVAVALSLGMMHLAAPQAAARASAPAKKAARNVSGTVRSSSDEAVVVTGRDKGKDAEWTFAVEPTTPIRKGTKAIVSRDLRPGDTVQVRFVERDGKALVESIRVREGRREPAKARERATR